MYTCNVDNHADLKMCLFSRYCAVTLLDLLVPEGWAIKLACIVANNLPSSLGPAAGWTVQRRGKGLHMYHVSNIQLMFSLKIEQWT